MKKSTLRARLAALSLVAASAVGATLVTVPAASAVEAPSSPQDVVTSPSEVPAAQGSVVEGGASSRYTSHPEGGTWIHGTDAGVYSKYHHASRKHGSSVINGAGNRARSADVAGGRWAVAIISKTWAGNTAYWRIF